MRGFRKWPYMLMLPVFFKRPLCRYENVSVQINRIVEQPIFIKTAYKFVERSTLLIIFLYVLLQVAVIAGTTF